MQIKSGTVDFNRGTDPTMDGGSGPRHYRKTVNYGGFRRPPTVVTSVTGFDVYNSANARVSVNAENVDDDSCVIHLHTWADTKIWSVTVNWMAYGD